MEEFWVGRLVGQRRGDDSVVGEPRFSLGQRQIKPVEQPLPARAHRGDGFQRRLPAVAEQHGVVEVGVALLQRQIVGLALQKGGECVAQRQLVLDRQFDVDALDAVAIVAHARQRDDDVLVELEGVGVAGDGGGARAVEPEFLARVGIHCDEALGRAKVAHAHDLRSGGHHRRFVMTDDVAEQDHLGTPVSLGLGRIADRPHVAFVEVFEAGELHARRVAGAARLEVVGDLDDRRHRFAHLAEEFETDGARYRWHGVQHPARRDDQAVGALLLDTGQAGEELVGDVLAEPGLAEGRAGNVEQFGIALERDAVVGETPDLEAHPRLIVNLAEVVADARDFHPVAIDIDHLPPGQVIERGAPQHGLLAAGVHGDVAADAGGVGRGRVDGEDVTRRRRGFGDTVGDDTGAGAHGGIRLVGARQRHRFDRADVDQFFGVDDGRQRRQRHGRAGVAGATAARDQRQAEFDAAAHERRDLSLAIGVENDKRVFDAPVGGVGDVRDARHAVEGDVVAARMLEQRLEHAGAQRGGLLEMVFEGVDG